MEGSPPRNSAPWGQLDNCCQCANTTGLLSGVTMISGKCWKISNQLFQPSVLSHKSSWKRKFSQILYKPKSNSPNSKRFATNSPQLLCANTSEGTFQKLPERHLWALSLLWWKCMLQVKQKPEPIQLQLLYSNSMNCQGIKSSLFNTTSKNTCLVYLCCMTVAEKAYKSVLVVLLKVAQM